MAPPFPLASPSSTPFTILATLAALGCTSAPGKHIPADSGDDKVVLEDDLVDVEPPGLGLVAGGDNQVTGGQVA